MKASTLARRLDNGEKKSVVIKQFIKESLPDKSMFDDLYPKIKGLFAAIAKFWVLSWFFTTRVLPSQGMEKTTIFLMLLIFVMLINLSRKIE